MKSAPRRTAARREDGLLNIYTKLGDPSRDKTMGARWRPITIDEWSAEELWLGGGIFARIIETEPEAMLRKGFGLAISDVTASPAPEGPERTDDDTGVENPGAELAADLLAKCDDLDVTGTFIQAMQYARAYGGAAILVGADDGQDFEEPLDERRIKSVKWLKVLRPRECRPARYYRRPKATKHGEPSHYNVQRETLGGNSGAMMVVHESRIIPFMGIVTSTWQRARNNGWGESVLVRVVQEVFNFTAAMQGVGVLVSDFAQAVFGMEGLAELLAQGPDGEKTVMKRAEIVDTARSVARALLIDKNETFERKATPVSGLPELIDRLCNHLSAVTHIPVTVLMGTAPAGLNATGAADLKNYHDGIDGRRERALRRHLNRLIKVLFLAKDSPTKGKEPKRWKVQFGPVSTLTPMESADVRLKTAQADSSDINAGVLMPEEVAASRYAGDEYSTETRLNTKLRSVKPMEPEPQPEPNPDDEPTKEPPEPKPAPEPSR